MGEGRRGGGVLGAFEFREFWEFWDAYFIGGAFLFLV